MTDTFVMRGEWLKNAFNAPEEIRNKIITDICCYGAGLPLQYEDDWQVSLLVNSVKGSIDASKEAYNKKVEMSKSAGRKKVVSDDAIYELAIKGYTAQEIANELGISKSSVDKSAGWKKRCDKVAF